MKISLGLPERVSLKEIIPLIQVKTLGDVLYYLSLVAISQIYSWAMMIHGGLKCCFQFKGKMLAQVDLKIIPALMM